MSRILGGFTALWKPNSDLTCICLWFLGLCIWMRSSIKYFGFHIQSSFIYAAKYDSHFTMQPEIPFLSVLSSMTRLMQYNLGSVALGSLIVSFVESIRFLLEAIRRKLKDSSDGHNSCIGKAAYRSSQCFLKCIEWTIKSVNRNAYILVNFVNLW